MSEPTQLPKGWSLHFGKEAEFKAHIEASGAPTSARLEPSAIEQAALSRTYVRSGTMPWGFETLPDTLAIGLKTFVQFDEALCLYLWVRSYTDPGFEPKKFKNLAQYADDVRQGFTASGQVPLIESMQSIYLAIANSHLGSERDESVWLEQIFEFFDHIDAQRLVGTNIFNEPLFRSVPTFSRYLGYVRDDDAKYRQDRDEGQMFLGTIPAQASITGRDEEISVLVFPATTKSYQASKWAYQDPESPCGLPGFDLFVLLPSNKGAASVSANPSRRHKINWLAKPLSRAEAAKRGEDGLDWYDGANHQFGVVAQPKPSGTALTGDEFVATLKDALDLRPPNTRAQTTPPVVVEPQAPSKSPPSLMVIGLSVLLAVGIGIGLYRSSDETGAAPSIDSQWAPNAKSAKAQMEPTRVQRAKTEKIQPPEAVQPPRENRPFPPQKKVVQTWPPCTQSAVDYVGRHGTKKVKVRIEKTESGCVAFAEYHKQRVDSYDVKIITNEEKGVGIRLFSRGNTVFKKRACWSTLYRKDGTIAGTICGGYMKLQAAEENKSFRGVSVARPSAATLNSIGKIPAYRGLMIGIDKYKDKTHWEPLKAAVRDVESIHKILTDQYRFPKADLKLLKNHQATKAAVKKALEELRDRTNEGDSVFIYYAGHGDYVDENDGNKEGHCWVLHDSIGKRCNNNALSASEIQRRLKWIGDKKPKHMLLVSDSCFSGALTSRGSATRPHQQKTKTKLKAYRTKHRMPSFQVLTSGDTDRKVYDSIDGEHSPFAKALLDVLKYPESEDGFVSGDDLKIVVSNYYNDIEEIRYIPHLKPIAKMNSRGDFVFIPKTIDAGGQ